MSKQSKKLEIIEDAHAVTSQHRPMTLRKKPTIS